MPYFSFFQDFTFCGHDVKLPIIFEMRLLLSLLHFLMTSLVIICDRLNLKKKLCLP